MSRWDTTLVESLLTTHYSLLTTQQRSFQDFLKLHTGFVTGRVNSLNW